MSIAKRVEVAKKFGAAAWHRPHRRHPIYQWGIFYKTRDELPKGTTYRRAKKLALKNTAMLYIFDARMFLCRKGHPMHHAELVVDYTAGWLSRIHDRPKRK